MEARPTHRPTSYTGGKTLLPTKQLSMPLTSSHHATSPLQPHTHIYIAQEAGQGSNQEATAAVSPALGGEGVLVTASNVQGGGR